MTDNEIEALKSMLAARGSQDALCWNPEPDEVRRIRAIGPPPDEEVPEPSECAYLLDGGYVALYDCELDDFVVTTPVRHRLAEAMHAKAHPLESHSAGRRCVWHTEDG